MPYMLTLWLQVMKYVRSMRKGSVATPMEGDECSLLGPNRPHKANLKLFIQLGSR